VSYDVQQDGTKWAPFSTVESIVDTAFAQWTAAACTPDAAGMTKVGIAATDLGPVACDLVQYNSDQGNQHVIIFHDTEWPHDDGGAGGTGAISANTLGLTTVTFDADTGEIYDVDTEINGTQPLSVSDPPPAGSFDLASIITHEMGHFLGLAHSDQDTATMYAFYSQGSTSMRTLTDDDKAGLCAIYPPDGTRSVGMAVSSTQSIPADACDPTPRHGFQSECAHPVSSGCGVAFGSADGDRMTAEAWVVALAAFGVVGRRKRRSNTPS
jgi:MYXO-CTERM domain-containing protein